MGPYVKLSSEKLVKEASVEQYEEVDHELEEMRMKRRDAALRRMNQRSLQKDMEKQHMKKIKLKTFEGRKKKV